MQRKRTSLIAALSLVMVLAAGCNRTTPARRFTNTAAPAPSPAVTVAPLPVKTSPQLTQLLEPAVAQSKVTTGYDPSWVKIAYPNGDVPQETGVCSDVVVRAFRKTGIDLQKEVHEDMTQIG